MLNAIWIALILLSIVCGSLTGKMAAVTQQSVMAAKSAVMLAIGLIGIMAFWLGMVQVAREAGLLRVLARALRPVMTRLFPEVPEDHPAMSAMIMNMASNMLGLGNAATPFGLKAMMELDKLNRHKGTATNAMALFLAINTSNIALFPTGVIAVRAAMGSTNPTAILFTTLFATFCSTCVAILVAKTLQRLPKYRIQHEEGTHLDTEQMASEHEEHSEEPTLTLPTEEELGPTCFPATPLKIRLLQWCFWLTLLVAALLHVTTSWLTHILTFAGESVLGWQAVVDATMATDVGLFTLSRDILSYWLLPALMASILLYGLSKGVKVYESLVAGAKEGFDVATRIIPYLVAILVAVGMFRASGALDILISGIVPFTQMIGMPAEALPMALMRPLSGSGAFGIMAEAMQANGPDSMTGYMVSTFQGSTETTFYVMAVYFGSVQVKRVRHTLATCLCADLAGVIAAVWICIMMFS